MIAMLLAAGRGERMRPLTDHTPKPLLQAGGKPLIVWHIEKLVRAGITDLVINHAHLGTQIEAALGDGSRFGAQIRYSPEATALETAGGIAYALPLLGAEPFAVINSDIYCDYDFAQLAAHAAALNTCGDSAHLVLVNNPVHHPNGDFHLHGGRLLPSPASGRGVVTSDLASVVGQPSRMASSSIRGEGLATKFTFSGIGIYRPALFKDIARGSVAPLAPLLRAQIALGKVSGEHYTGRWIDVGTPQRLEQLDNELRTSQNGIHA